MCRFLRDLDAHLRCAGYHPSFGPLLGELVVAHSALGAALASRLLDSGVESALVLEVPALAYAIPGLTEAERFALLARTAHCPVRGAADAVAGFLAWRAYRPDDVPTADEAGLLIELATKPDAGVAVRLLDFCKEAGEASLPLVYRILGSLPLAVLPASVVGGVWEVLVPYRKRRTALPTELVTHLFEQLVGVPKLDVHQHAEQFHELTVAMPRAIYTLLRARVLQAVSSQAPNDYAPLPDGYDFAIQLPGLATEPDYAAVCDELWQRVLNGREPQRFAWRALWQAVVMNEAEHWLPRLLREVEGAQSAEHLKALVDLIGFGGSLVVFRFADLTRAYLIKAEALGGVELAAEVRAKLVSATGPSVRAYTDGRLDREYDYVEAEAAKAAERHASDPLLGPFYRWIVRWEQSHRLWEKARVDAQVAAWD